MTGIMQMVLPSRTITPPNFLSQLSTTTTYNEPKTDSSGNVYVVGQADNNIDILITKYDSLGVLQWQRKLGLSSGNNRGYGTALDSSANLYICGATNSLKSIQVAKYNTSGAIQFQRTLTGSGTTDCVAFGIAIDSSANFYICGYTTEGGGSRAVVAKYNSSGTLQWQRQYNNGNSIMYGIGLDSSANVYLCGYGVFSTFNFWTLKYNSSGTFQWARRLGSGTPGFGRAGAVDSSGNVYNVGYWNNNIAIAKYDTSGTLQWQRSLTHPSQCQGWAAAVDSSGNLYISGRQGTAFYIIAKYNSSGVIQWQRSLTPSSGSIVTEGLTLSPTQTDYYLTGTLNFTNAQLFKFPTDGSKTGAYVLGSTTYTYAASSLTDAALSLSDVNEGNYDAALTLTDAASSLTDAASSFTSTTTNF